MLCLVEKVQIKENLFELLEHQRRILFADEIDIKRQKDIKETIMKVFVYLGIDLNEEEKKLLEG